MREKAQDSSSPNGSLDTSANSSTKKDDDTPCDALPILDTQTSTLSEDLCSNSENLIDNRNLGENNPSFSQTASDDDSEFCA